MDENNEYYEDDENLEQDSFDQEQSGDIEQQPGVVDNVGKSAAHGLGKAVASHYGGSLGGKAYDAFSQTAIGKALEEKAARKLKFKIYLILIGVVAVFLLFLVIIAFFIDDGTFGDTGSDSDSLVYESVCNFENTMVTVMDHTNTIPLATVSLEDYIIGVAVFEIGAHSGKYATLPEDYVKTQYIAAKTWLLSTKGYDNSDKTITVTASTKDQQWCDLELGCYVVDLTDEMSGLYASYPGGHNGVSATSYLTEEDLETARRYYSETYGQLYLPSSYNDVISYLNSNTATYYIDVTQNFWRSQANNGKSYDEILELTGTSVGEVGYTDWNGVVTDISTYYSDGSIYKMENYCKAVENDASSSDVEVSYASGGLPIPVYYQNDYPNVYLSSDRVKTVSSSGCGFTSCAMIVSYLLDQTVTPANFVDDWSRPYYVYGVGMSHSLPAAAASHYGLGSVTTTYSSSVMYQALKDGHPVMSSQGPGIFTNGGHIIVLRGVTADGKILVNDPWKPNGYNNRAFSLSEITASGGAYFIWPKKG